VFVTVGLHPCGSLSDEILTRAPTFTTDAVILVPCCYSKCTAECSPFLRQGDDKLFDVCRLCERNDDVQTSETAMRIINDRRVEQARTLKNKWKWDIDIMHRDYTGKNIVIVGRKDDVRERAKRERVEHVLTSSTGTYSVFTLAAVSRTRKRESGSSMFVLTSSTSTHSVITIALSFSHSSAHRYRGKTRWQLSMSKMPLPALA